MGQPAHLDKLLQFLTHLSPCLWQKNVYVFPKTTSLWSHLVFLDLVSRAETRKCQSFLLSQDVSLNQQDLQTFDLIWLLPRFSSISKMIFNKSSRQFQKHDFLQLVTGIGKPLRILQSRLSNPGPQISTKANLKQIFISS